MKKNIFIFILGAPLLAVIMVSLQIYYYLSIWTYSGQDVTFDIRPGESFSSINYRLHKSNYIISANVFYRYAKHKNLITKFKAGRYVIKSESTMLDIISTFISGKSISKHLTIPEGKNMFEIGKLLEQKNITKYSDFIDLAKNKSFMEKLGLNTERVEGYLYPDTYKFAENTPAKQVIKTMVSEFKRKIKTINLSNSPFTLHNLVTLASIVEKETGAKKERPLIAQVFLNRLNKKMRLQSDPTTIYGIYENFNGNLRKRHLREKTPYNTYKINGLPKGPISNPGLESIKAVLNPAKHKYIYFVSKNDGTHVFSESYRAHTNAVNKFQKNRRNRKGKSWRNLKQ